MPLSPNYYVSGGVKVAPAPAPLNNVNNICIFTTDQPVTPPTQGYKQYVSLEEIELDYGSTTETYKMAFQIFSQPKTFQSAGANGVLFITPMLANANPATSGTATTASTMTANVANFATQDSMDLQLSIDGAVSLYEGISFLGVTTVDEIVNILQSRLQGYALVQNDAEKIKFVSLTQGASSVIEVQPAVGGTGVDMAGVSYLDSATMVLTTGTDATGESLPQAIARMFDIQPLFYGILTNLRMSEDEFKATATYIEGRQLTQACMWVYGTESINQGIDPTGLAAWNVAEDNTHTILVMYTLDIVKAIATVMGYTLSNSFAATGTSSDLNAKSPLQIAVDPAVNNSNIQQLQDNGLITITGVGNDSVAQFQSPSVPLPIAAVYGLDQLNIEINNALRKLYDTQPKLPPNQEGFSRVINICNSVCAQAVVNGIITPGTWTNSTILGNNPEEFKASIASKGYFCWASATGTGPDAIMQPEVAVYYNNSVQKIIYSILAQVK